MLKDEDFRKLIEEVQQAARALNFAIQRAHHAGLKVDIRATESRVTEKIQAPSGIEDAWVEQPRVEVDVRRQ